MSQENEIEAEKPSLTTDFIPSGGAPCSAGFSHSGVWCCTEKSKCQWQGFALHQGLAWGVPNGTTDEWMMRHNTNCSGRLIQLIPPSVEEPPHLGVDGTPCSASSIREKVGTERWLFIADWCKKKGISPMNADNFDRAAMEWAKLNCFPPNAKEHPTAGAAGGQQNQSYKQK